MHVQAKAKFYKWHKVTGNIAFICAGWRRNDKCELKNAGLGWAGFCFALLCFLATLHGLQDL